jgi:SnoaL-like domain
VAFSHSLRHVSAAKPDGGKLDVWWRTTICFRKIDGKWMITHLYSSVPFDPETGKASFDLKPQHLQNHMTLAFYPTMERKR